MLEKKASQSNTEKTTHKRTTSFEKAYATHCQLYWILHRLWWQAYSAGQFIEVRLVSPQTSQCSCACGKMSVRKNDPDVCYHTCFNCIRYSLARTSCARNQPYGGGYIHSWPQEAAGRVSQCSPVGSQKQQQLAAHDGKLQRSKSDSH